jgi:hypothetical protein
MDDRLAGRARRDVVVVVEGEQDPRQVAEGRGGTSVREIGLVRKGERAHPGAATDVGRAAAS